MLGPMATSHAGAGFRMAGQIASAAVGWLALLGVVLACARPVGLEDRACPCAQGKAFVCCELTGLCVKWQLYQAAACLAGRDAASARGDLANQIFGDAGGAPSIDAEAVAPDPAPRAPDASTPPGEAPAGRMQCPYNPACYVEDEIYCEPGIGLVRGTYYDNLSFTGTAVTRLERGLSFDWETGSPDPTIASDTFAAFWNTGLMPELDGDYTFFINADDGFRFWLNDELLLDWWQGPLGRPLAITVPLERHTSYDLLLEHFDETGLAFVDVTWQRGTGPRTAIPDCLLSERSISRAPATHPPVPASLRARPTVPRRARRVMAWTSATTGARISPTWRTTSPPAPSIWIGAGWPKHRAAEIVTPSAWRGFWRPPGARPSPSS